MEIALLFINLSVLLLLSLRSLSEAFFLPLLGVKARKKIW
jgi:hypothetical protein